MARPARTSGITGQMSGFASAVTQFWDAFDLKSVSRVSKTDHAMTEHIWCLSAAMCSNQGPKCSAPNLDSSSMAKTSLTFMQVLRERRGNPLCFAFAQTQSLRRIRASLSIQTRISMGIDSKMRQYPSWKAFDIHPRRSEILFARGGHEMHLDPFTDHQYKQAVVHAEHFADINLQTCNVCTQIQTTRFLWSMLLEVGHLLHWVWWTSCAESGHLWMALDVAPTIPFQSSTIPSHDPSLTELRLAYKDRIQFDTS